MHVFADSDAFATLSSTTELKGNNGKASRRMLLRKILFITFVTCAILISLYFIEDGVVHKFASKVRQKVKKVQALAKPLKPKSIGLRSTGLQSRKEIHTNTQKDVREDKKDLNGNDHDDDAEEGRLIKFYVSNLESSLEEEGSFTIRTRPSWSPNGVERFEELTKQSFWNECRFFRAIDNFVVQWGINGNSATQSKWDGKTFKDEKVIGSNTRGTVVFAMSGPNTRETQMYINTKNNKGLDKQGFTPIAEVIHGMDIVDKIYTGYKGDPVQWKIEKLGNTYLNENFPKLSFIRDAQFE